MMGLGFRVDYPPLMENKMEKRMENEMEHGGIYAFNKELNKLLYWGNPTIY